MSCRRLFVLVFACALLFGAPVLLQAGGGAAIHIDENGTCYWQCYGGSVGSAPISPYSCLQLCRNACGGPCIALY
jgi:hypothetical protein